MYVNVVDPCSVDERGEMPSFIPQVLEWEKSEVIHACTIADSLCIRSLHLTLISREVAPFAAQTAEPDLYYVLWRIVERG